MGITKTHTRPGHDLTIDCELEVTRLLQCRMLRPDRNDKGIATDNAWFGSYFRRTTFYSFRLLDRKICTQRKYILGPIVGNEQTLITACTTDMKAQRFM